VTVPGVTVQAVLLVEKDTTPLKPLMGVRVTVEVPVMPVLAVSVAGLAASVKSVIVKVIVIVRLSEPLVPVTATLNVSADKNVHDRVELPEPTKVVGVKVQEVLLVARLTTPEKPFRAVTLMVEVLADPASAVRLVGFAASAKSWIVYATVVECDREPLVPVNVTWRVLAAEKLHDNVELPEPVTFVGETVHNVLFVARSTTPANPLRAVIAMVEVAAVPVLTVRVVGLASMVKS
jgi:hypothetical protein